jgi:hypothetical protein
MAKQILKMKVTAKQGMHLGKYIAAGGKPKDFKGALSNAVVKGKK